MTTGHGEAPGGSGDSGITTASAGEERHAQLLAAPTICVIEDDEAIRQIVRALLEDEGYQVVEAADGLAGYRLLRTAPAPLVAVVDHKLPRMDGCNLLELVAQDEELRARHAFIFLTANPRRAEEDCGESLEELGAPLIAKPFDIDQLLTPVAEAVQRLTGATPQARHE